MAFHIYDSYEWLFFAQVAIDGIYNFHPGVRRCFYRCNSLDFFIFLKEHKRLLLKFYGYVYFLKDVWSISQQLKDFPCIALISSKTGYNFLILKQDSQRQHKIELYFL